MSLLPIIYTSLIITGVLLFVIILISYLTYKFKSDKTPMIDKSNILEPIRIPGQPRRNNQEQIVYRTQALKPIPKPIKSKLAKEANKTVKYETRPERVITRKPEYVNPLKPQKSFSSTKRDQNEKEFQKSRIQIINDTKYFTKSYKAAERNKSMKMTIPPGINILEFYSDNNQPLVKLGS